MRGSVERFSYGQVRGRPLQQFVEAYSRGFASSLGWADVKPPLVTAAGVRPTAEIFGQPQLTSLLRAS